MKNVDRYFPEYRKAQQADAPAENKAMAYITLSVPAKVDGYIKLKLNDGDDLRAGGYEEDSNYNLEYKKIGQEIFKQEKGESATEPAKSPSRFVNGMLIMEFDIAIEKKHYEMIFSLSSLEERYIPLAQDKASFNG